MSNGVCVLPSLNEGQNAEEFLMNARGSFDTWTIVSGSLPPGMQMYAQYAAGSTIIYGTPTQQGTFTFTVDNVPYNQPGATPAQVTYSITVGAPLPLKVVLPASGVHAAAGHGRRGLRAELLPLRRRGALHLVGGLRAAPAGPGAQVHRCAH
jgi:hypothetical protein